MYMFDLAQASKDFCEMAQAVFELFSFAPVASPAVSAGWHLPPKVVYAPESITATVCMRFEIRLK